MSDYGTRFAWQNTFGRWLNGHDRRFLGENDPPNYSLQYEKKHFGSFRIVFIEIRLVIDKVGRIRGERRRDPDVLTGLALAG
jgi:hypothetical protein